MPDKTLRRSAIGKDVTLVGLGNHLELWNRNEWEIRSNELLEKSSEIALQAMEAKRSENKA